jgi:hypothetical protein
MDILSTVYSSFKVNFLKNSETKNDRQLWGYGTMTTIFSLQTFRSENSRKLVFRNPVKKCGAFRLCGEEDLNAKVKISAEAYNFRLHIVLDGADYRKKRMKKRFFLLTPNLWF